MQIFIVHKNIKNGGAETLILRIAKYLGEKRTNYSILCNSISDSMVTQFEGQGIHYIKYPIWNSDVLRNISNGDKILSFELLEYIMCNNYLYKNKFDNCQNIIYVIHPLTLIAYKDTKSKLLKNIVRHIVFGVVKDIIKNKKVYFVDEMCIEWTEKYYNIQIKNREAYILHLPIFVPVYCGDNIRQKATRIQDKHIIQILTVFRAEFPFKGYIKGLIDSLSKYDGIYNINLLIVSFGDGFDQIKKWIKTSSTNHKIKISLQGETSYQELQEYYKTSDLFIGMGTSVLDSAANGVDSIVVKPYTYDFLSSGFYHNDPDTFAADTSYDDGMKYLYDFLNWSSVDYEITSRKVYEDISNKYDISVFFKRLFADNPIVIQSTPFSLNILINCWKKIKNIS